MKIFLLETDQKMDYDIFDGCVVVANSEEEARLMHPEGDPILESGTWHEARDLERTYVSLRWASHPDKVKVTYLGESNENTARVILASNTGA